MSDNDIESKIERRIFYKRNKCNCGSATESNQPNNKIHDLTIKLENRGSDENLVNENENQIVFFYELCVAFFALKIFLFLFVAI